MFETQKLLPNEKIKKIYASHRIFYGSLGIQFFLLILLLWWGIYFFKNSYYSYFWAIILLQTFFAYLYFALMQYEFSKVIFTNQRILWFKKISLFEYDFFEVSLDKIEEIKWLRKWFLANIFDYGNINLTLHNGKNEIYILKNISHNIEQTKFIYDLLLQYKKDFNTK